MKREMVSLAGDTAVEYGYPFPKRHAPPGPSFIILFYYYIHILFCFAPV